MIAMSMWRRCWRRTAFRSRRRSRSHCVRRWRNSPPFWRRWRWSRCESRFPRGREIRCWRTRTWSWIPNWRRFPSMVESWKRGTRKWRGFRTWRMAGVSMAGAFPRPRRWRKKSGKSWRAFRRTVSSRRHWWAGLGPDLTTGRFPAQNRENPRGARKNRGRSRCLNLAGKV